MRQNTWIAVVASVHPRLPCAATPVRERSIVPSVGDCFPCQKSESRRYTVFHSMLMFMLRFEGCTFGMHSSLWHGNQKGMDMRWTWHSSMPNLTPVMNEAARTALCFVCFEYDDLVHTKLGMPGLDAPSILS